jgi:hypothetical protein
LSPKISEHREYLLRVSHKNIMFGLAYAAAIFLFLSSAVMGVSGCAHVNQQSVSQEVKVTPQPLEVKTFFAAGNEASYRGLQNLSSSPVDLSAYAHQMEIKYPRTFQIDVLTKPPRRPYKSFAVLECEPAPPFTPGEVMEKLKDKAREIGADAIILSGAGPDQGLPGIPLTSKMQAVAIKYLLTREPDKGNTS